VSSHGEAHRFVKQLDRGRHTLGGDAAVPHWQSLLQSRIACIEGSMNGYTLRESQYEHIWAAIPSGADDLRWGSERRKGVVSGRQGFLRLSRRAWPLPDP
jgi:hypothetical protein